MPLQIANSCVLSTSYVLSKKLRSLKILETASILQIVKICCRKKCIRKGIRKYSYLKVAPLFPYFVSLRVLSAEPLHADAQD